MHTDLTSIASHAQLLEVAIHCMLEMADRLVGLRDLMRQEHLAAYIIPTDDAHQVLFKSYLNKL